MWDEAGIVHIEGYYEAGIGLFDPGDVDRLLKGLLEEPVVLRADLQRCATGEVVFLVHVVGSKVERLAFVVHILAVAPARRGVAAVNLDTETRVGVGKYGHLAGNACCACGCGDGCITRADGFNEAGRADFCHAFVVRAPAYGLVSGVIRRNACLKAYRAPEIKFHRCLVEGDFSNHLYFLHNHMTAGLDVREKS